MPKQNEHYKRINKNLAKIKSEVSGEVLEVVEERDRRILEALKDQNKVLNNALQEVITGVDAAKNKVIKDTQEFASEDFKALRSEISKLEQQLGNFDADQEAKRLVQGYKSTLDEAVQQVEWSDKRINAGVRNIEDSVRHIRSIREGVYKDWSQRTIKYSIAGAFLAGLAGYFLIPFLGWLFG